jgi:chromosome segregation ATPase
MGARNKQSDTSSQSTETPTGSAEPAPSKSEPKKRETAKQTIPGPDRHRSYPEQIRELQRQVLALEAEVSRKDQRIDSILEQYEDAHDRLANGESSSAAEDYPPTRVEEYFNEAKIVLAKLVAKSQTRVQAWNRKLSRVRRKISEKRSSTRSFSAGKDRL